MKPEKPLTPLAEAIAESIRALPDAPPEKQIRAAANNAAQKVVGLFGAQLEPLDGTEDAA